MQKPEWGWCRLSKNQTHQRSDVVEEDNNDQQGTSLNARFTPNPAVDTCGNERRIKHRADSSEGSDNVETCFL